VLSQAKDFQDILRIQTEFMQMQFSVFAEQTKSLTEACFKGDRCVYRKLKPGHNGDAVRQGSRGNGYFQLVELGAKKARPYLASDAFAIHYNRRHTRPESGAGALRPV
jgi:hypothetical protein